MSEERASPEASASLAGRAASAGGAMLGRLRAWAAKPRVATEGRFEWRVAGAIAALLLLSPFVTILLANRLATTARADAARIAAEAAPRVAAAQGAERAHGELRVLLRRPTLGVTMEALARALPEDATVVRAERTADGALEVEIATSDPDPLRAALHRVPELAGLRATGQRRGDAAMLVTLRSAAE